MKILFNAGLIFCLIGCAEQENLIHLNSDEPTSQAIVEPVEIFHQQNYSLPYDEKPLCDGNIVSNEAAEQMVELTTLSDDETIYTTYDRIDRIATLFEDCGDPWGMFPTTYRHITNRIIEAIEDQEIEDQEWGREIVLDFASRYMENLQLALLGQQPSYAWNQYYYLADHPDVSRTRAVVIAMVAHLTLDLPYSLVQIGTTEDHKNDYFVLGERWSSHARGSLPTVSE